MKRKVHSDTAYHFILTENYYYAPKPNERKEKRCKKGLQNLKWSQVTFKLKQIQDRKKCILFYVSVLCVYAYMGDHWALRKLKRIRFSLFYFADSCWKCKKSWLYEKKGKRKHESQERFFFTLFYIIWSMFECRILEHNSLIKQNRCDDRGQIKSFDLGIRFNWMKRKKNINLIMTICEWWLS